MYMPVNRNLFSPILLLLTACSPASCGMQSPERLDYPYRDERTRIYQDPPEEILRHVLKYEELTGAEVRGRVGMRYSEVLEEPEDPNVHRVGECRMRGFHNIILEREILLETEFYKTAHYWMQEQLVFHELGHCIHLQGHTERGLMGPTLDYGYLEPETREEMIQDFLEQINMGDK